MILFDEIEKAHPDVAQILLQVLEDGRLTDSLGRTVDFRNTILIMTSNVGAEMLQRNTSTGFDVGLSDARDFERLKERVMDEAKKVFKPEFINRLSDIVIFHRLGKEQMRQIVDLELAQVLERLGSREIDLQIAEDAKYFLVDQGYDDKFGARPLRRAVEKFLEDPLAEAILRGDLKRSETIQVTLAEDGKGLEFHQQTATVG